MELVAPAGNIDKLKFAYLYGADAAYIGIKNFSLRQRADNFRETEYEKIKEIKGDKKLFGAFNIYFYNNDLRRLEEEAGYISRYPFDAFIISDLGVLPVMKKYFPNTPLHLSTQANCTNAEAAKMYRDLGFSRIILGREVGLSEIEEIKKASGVAIEVFVHGAMCMSYSGRCYLSAYMAGRSGNRGDCAHPCRWNFRVLEEEERPGEYFPIEEDDHFTSIMSSKDLCMIDHLDKLRDAGVDACKIEGRMKSVYYVAVTCRAYRKAIDNAMGKTVADIQPYIDELYNVSHREFWTGFFFDKEEIAKPTLASYTRGYLFLGTVLREIKPGLFLLDVKNSFAEGQTIEYTGFDILSIEDESFALYEENEEPTERADHHKPCLLKTNKLLKPGYILRRRMQE
ncbi:MAG: U32 family peptidase C-terminal domain-containing protein [Spirochaetales bacterium]|nr:U32 family peptidase C-terminal domain-containing protein [Spirochaetales bacterium]